MSTEIELKLLVATKNLARLRDVLAKLAGACRPRRQHLLSHYFDTPTLELRDEGAALRVRKVGRQWVQTLKAGGGVTAGMHQRGEWETPVEEPFPDLGRVAASFPDDKTLARVLKKLPAIQALQRVFSTDFHRDIFNFTQSDGSQVEAAVDEGAVRLGKTGTPISELELELKSGDPLTLLELARRVLSEVPLRLGVATKAQRGYALLEDGTVSPPRQAAELTLCSSLPVGEAFARIFAECFDHLLENTEGVIEQLGPEYLHQMRVAIRRLRGALGVFGDVVPRVVFAGLAHELQQAGLALGDARNWEVLRHETLPACPAAKQADMSSALEEQLRAHAQAATVKARRLTASKRFTDTMLRTAIFISGRRWRFAEGESTAAALAEPISVFARRALLTRHKKLKKRVALALHEQAESLHEARIAAKKLRYTLEFFASLFPKKAVRHHLRHLANLQDILGTINDAATAIDLLAHMVELSPHLLPEVTQWEAALTVRSRRGQRQFAKAWAHFAKRPVMPQ